MHLRLQPSDQKMLADSRRLCWRQDHLSMNLVASHKDKFADGHQLYHGICLSRRRQPTAIPCSHHRFAKRSPDSAFTWLKPKLVIRLLRKPCVFLKRETFNANQSQTNQKKKMLTFSVLVWFCPWRLASLAASSALEAPSALPFSMA